MHVQKNIKKKKQFYCLISTWRLVTLRGSVVLLSAYRHMPEYFQLNHYFFLSHPLQVLID